MKKILAIILLSFFLVFNIFIVKNSEAVTLPKLSPPCSENSWEKPCSCSRESNWAKKRFCNFKMGTDKAPIVETCADESRGYSESVSKKVYKECMKKYGF